MKHYIFFPFLEVYYEDELCDVIVTLDNPSRLFAPHVKTMSQKQKRVKVPNRKRWFINGTSGFTIPRRRLLVTL